MINEDSILTFDLSIQEKDDLSFYVGNKNVNMFIEIPIEGVNVLSLFDGKKTVAEIEKDYIEFYGEEIDILGFVRSLETMNLIYTNNGEVVGENNKYSKTSIFNPIANLVFANNKYLLILFIGLLSIIALFVSNNFPSLDDAIIIKNYSGISYFLMFITSWSITVFHELGHYLAAVYLNIPTKYSFSLRYFLLVVEADINSIWSVSKKERYKCYFAGICFESILLILSTIIIFIDPTNGFFKLVTLIIILNFLGQFMLFLRTDIYYAIMNALSLNGLHMYALEIFRGKRKQGEFNELLPKEKRYVYIFILIIIIGAIISAGYILSEIVIAKDYIKLAIDQIRQIETYKIIDGICTIIVILIGIFIWLLGLLSSLRERRNNE